VVYPHSALVLSRRIPHNREERRIAKGELIDVPPAMNGGRLIDSVMVVKAAVLVLGRGPCLSGRDRAS
jgi:hypothetical protein